MLCNNYPVETKFDLYGIKYRHYVDIMCAIYKIIVASENIFPKCQVPH